MKATKLNAHFVFFGAIGFPATLSDGMRKSDQPVAVVAVVAEHPTVDDGEGGAGQVRALSEMAPEMVRLKTLKRVLLSHPLQANPYPWYTFVIHTILPHIINQRIREKGSQLNGWCW